ncbi:MAG: aminoglycoside phosphotransferase, partial [Sphingomonadales bacterium]
MTAEAGQREALTKALLGEGGLDAAAIQTLADAIGREHAASRPAKADAFRALLDEAARTPAQRLELSRHAAQIDRRIASERVRVLESGEVDVLFDLARPLAALAGLGRTGDANLLANRYLDVTPQGATGWALLPLYLSLHAGDALADAILAPAPPRLIAIGGLSGTG